MSSGGEGRRVSVEDIQLVQQLIELCLQQYMSKKEVVETLTTKANIEPGFTQLVWQRLEDENKEFFKAYYVRLLVKQQIMIFNGLLVKNVELMRKTRPVGAGSSLPMSNGSNASSLRPTAPRFVGGQGVQPPSRPENIMHPLMGCSSTVVNGRPTGHGNIRKSVNDDASVRTGRIDVSPPNMLPTNQNPPHTGLLRPSRARENMHHLMGHSGMLVNGRPTGHGSIMQYADEDASARIGRIDVSPPSMLSTDQSPPHTRVQQLAPQNMHRLMGPSSTLVNGRPSGHGTIVQSVHDASASIHTGRIDVLPPNMLPTDLNPPHTGVLQPSRAATENMHHLIGPSSTLVNGRPSGHGSIMQSVHDASTCTGRIDVSPSNMLPTDENPPHTGLIQGVNGIVIESRSGYSNSSPNFAFGLDGGDVLETRPTIGDASFGSPVESNSQALDTSFLETDTSRFGFLGQIPRNFSLSDLTADFTQRSDILGTYTRSPFLTADTDYLTIEDFWHNDS